MLEEEALLGKIALKRGILDREQLKECLRLRKKGARAKPLIAVLVEKGYVSDKDLEQILTDQRRILSKRQQSKRIQKKLRESQTGSVRRPRPAPAPEPDGKERVRMKHESVEIERCRYCGKPVPPEARRCQHCGKKPVKGAGDDRIDRKRAKSEYLCNLCFYPVFETETECPSCHAVFLRPGEGGEFKCSQCMHFVKETDTVCPWCQAVFT